MKKLIALAMSLIIATGLVGCGSEPKEDSAVTSESSESTSLAEETENTDAQVVIEHSKGTVTVPKNPKKIAVFDMSVLDTIDALGIDVEMALPVESLPSYLSTYESTATNAGGIKEPNIESLFNFEPEIIFINGRQADFYDQLSAIAPTVYLELNAETYMQEVYYNANIIYSVFGIEEDDKLLGLFKKADEVNQKISGREEKALVILVNNGKISTYGRGSRFGMIFDTLGVKPADENIEVSTHGQEVSYEYISQINPDMIFVIDRNDIVGGEGESIEALNNDLVNGTNAAKNGKIIKLDSEIWYLSGGGLSSVYRMIEEIEAAFN